MTQVTAPDDLPHIKLQKIFTSMAEGKEITAHDVCNAFAVILNDPTPTDAEIIKAMQAMVSRLPAEQHFDVWNSASGKRMSNDVDGYVARAALDALEDLPRYRRSEAASNRLDGRLPANHPIQQKAVRKILQYVQHSLDGFDDAMSAMLCTEDPKIKTGLLFHAIKFIGASRNEGTDYFSQAVACVDSAKTLGTKKLLKESCEKAILFFGELPREEQPKAKDWLMSVLNGDPMKEKVAAELDKITQTAETRIVADLVQKIGGLSL